MAEHSSTTPRWIYLLQLASVGFIWFFVIGISSWILHLNRLSHRLQDVPSATVAISIIAIPVFVTGASVLTYVFFGLQRGARDTGDASGTGE